MADNNSEPTEHVSQEDWEEMKPRKRTEPIDDEERITWSVYDDLDLPMYSESEKNND